MDRRELVTLMTLGAWPEMLVLGYLFNQRLIANATQIESISVDWASGAAEIVTRSGALIAAACGLESIQPPGPASARVTHSTLLQLLETMRAHQDIHRAAGSVHSCALFRGGELLLTVEDVGRHNAVDTIVGWMLMHGVPGSDKTLFTTGRLTGEMVLKAVRCGVPIAISRNGTSSLGYDLASRFGMTLIGRAANRRYLCYTGADRIEAEPTPPAAAATHVID